MEEAATFSRQSLDRGKSVSSRNDVGLWMKQGPRRNFTVPARLTKWPPRFSLTRGKTTFGGDDTWRFPLTGAATRPSFFLPFPFLLSDCRDSGHSNYRPAPEDGRWTTRETDSSIRHGISARNSQVFTIEKLKARVSDKERKGEKKEESQEP